MTIDDQVSKQQRALPAGQQSIQPLSIALDRQRPADLNPHGPRGRQGHVNILAIRCSYKPARRRGATAKLIRCECGFVARADSDDQVVGVIRAHMVSDHPALMDTVSRDDLLSWIVAE